MRRLGTDHIDLYQLHAFDESTALEETLSTLDGLVRAGLLRHLGVSNYAAWQLQKSVDAARWRGWEPPVPARLSRRLTALPRRVLSGPVRRGSGPGT